MTASIKEARERCRNYNASPLRMSNDDDEKNRRDDIVRCADAALASLSCGEAREKIKSAAAIRADERERCAKIADAESVYYRNLFVQGKSLRGAAYYVHDDTWINLQAREYQSAVIAAAIRAGRDEA